MVSALFLDITGAFPNVSIPMLLHNMRKRGIPQEYTEWLGRRLDGRKTTLHFDGYKSETRNVNNGLEQVSNRAARDHTFGFYSPTPT